MAHKKPRRRASKTTVKHAPEYVNDITASSMLMIPAPTLRRWRHEMRGPKFCKLEGLVRYCVTDLHAWARDREVDQGTEVA